MPDNNTRKNILVTILVTCILFVFSESIAYLILRHRGTAFSFLLMRNKSNQHTLDFMHECCGYDEADPLLGWAMTAEQLKKRDLTLQNNCIYFENILSESRDTLDIFITGGSTSDVGLMADNWPAKLADILKKENRCFRMYVGAVGAYSSGQEVLKLLRDGIPLQPDIHISYCGANEVENPYFVSTFEQHFYERTFTQAQTSKLFPNLVYLLREKLGINRKSMQLKAAPQTNPVAQWQQNMHTMKVLADGNNYLFMGILQPVAGIGKIQQYSQDEGTTYHVAQYKSFYPEALRQARNRAYLRDFTNIFDTIEMPFFDDCHVKEAYQHIPAEAVYQEMMSLIQHQEKH